MPPHPHDLRAAAYARLQAGALEEAEKLFTTALGIDPRDGGALRGLAAICHRQGRLAQAMAFFDRALEADPKDAAALTNRGNVLADMGHPEAALESFGRALEARPDFAGARLNRAIVLQELGRSGEALAEYERLLKADPRSAHALNGQGVALMASGRPGDALQSFATLLEVAPSPAAWNHYGLALQTLNRHQEAIAAYDRALPLQDAEIWNRRAVSLQQLGRLEEARTSLEKALALNPGYAPALRNLALLLSEENRLEEALAAFRRHAEIAPRPQADRPHKVRHDRERALYLASQRLQPSPEGGRVAGPAVRRRPPGEQVEQQWKNASPQILVVDDFLTADALAALRDYCLRADVWHRGYDGGYLGAMPEQGFTAPLLGQIAQDMRAVFPAVFGHHPLRYFWAFKYDSELAGTPVHADQAAVNVNFWITPDEANRDPEGGGLVLWDLAAPLDWDFDRYNSDPEACKRYLQQNGARRIVIPHRCNRAVIFDSDLFHMTDRLTFREGYPNRRINVTYLFGRRAAGPGMG